MGWFIFFYNRSFIIMIFMYYTILLLVYLLELFLPNINFTYIIILITTLNTLFNNFNVLVIGSHYLFDLTTRLDFNDSFINLFNFFWTSFTYLPSFFFLIFFQALLLKQILKTNYYIIMILLIYWLYNTELFDFIVTNYQFETMNTNHNSINLLLTNSLNKYHPLIFYVSVILFFNLLFSPIFNLFCSYNYFLLNNTNNEIKINVKFILMFNIFALFLGSWWALQEGTWGGWWNWDPSEVLGLLFSLFVLFIIHTYTNGFYDILLLFYRVNMYILITIITYLFIQLNFDLVSHNFGSKFFFFFNNNLFFLELLITLTLYWFCMYFKTQLSFVENIISIKKLKFTYYKPLTLQHHGLVLLTYVLIILVFNSIIPLLNYFIWTYLKINSFNFLINNTYFVFIFTILLISPFYMTAKPENYLLTFFLGLNSISYSTILLNTIKQTNNTISILHLLLVAFLIVNISSYSLTFIYWVITNPLDDVIGTDYSMFKLYNVTQCNSFLVETVCNFNSHIYNNLTSWNVFYHSNSQSLNTFNLLFDNNCFYNYYNLLDNYKLLYLFIETNELNNLIELCTILMTWFTIKLVTFKPHRTYF